MVWQEKEDKLKSHEPTSTFRISKYIHVFGRRTAGYELLTYQVWIFLVGDRLYSKMILNWGEKFENSYNIVELKN